MKKLLILVLALAMVFSMAACSDDSEAGLTVSEGKLIMGTNAAFPSYEYYENETIVGIDAEIAAAIADKLGLELQIEDMEFGSIVAAVESGKIDVGIAGMTVTPERQESVNFSTSYATGVQVVIVAEGSEITSVDDLYVEGATYAVGVQQDTTGDIYISGDIEKMELGLTVERYNKGADAVQALVSGKVDCVIIDNEPAKAFVDANEGLVILDTEYIIEDYAIAINKDNTELLDAINSALDELIADGTVQAIVDSYINAE